MRACVRARLRACVRMRHFTHTHTQICQHALCVTWSEERFTGWLAGCAAEHMCDVLVEWFISWLAGCAAEQMCDVLVERFTGWLAGCAAEQMCDVVAGAVH